MGGNIMGAEVKARGDNPTSAPVFLTAEKGTEVTASRRKSGGYATSVPVFFFVSIYLWLAPVPAHADRMGEGMAEIGSGILGTITLVLFGGSASVIGSASAKRAIDGERLSWQWQVAGWAFGILNGALGTFHLVLADKADIETSLIVGITHVTFGALGIGITIWGSCIPEKEGVAISPMVLPPPTGVEVGEPAFGFVLSGRF